MGKVTLASALLFVCMAISAFGQLDACLNTPDPSDHRAYFVDDHGVKKKMFCAPGSLFSPLTCSCGVNLLSHAFPHPAYYGPHYPYHRYGYGGHYYPWH